MNEKVFDYLQEYIDHMLPEQRERLMNLSVYQAYQSEKRRLSSRISYMPAGRKPFTSSALIAETQKLEALGNQVLEAAKGLDPYGD